ncbi:hypothetical protein VNI00_014338 [Paramarasmius palmivorus]|uniref:Uncharacterized protein n=1 Tax=Paramarasmius palmivorus TaxID=297713 RepID=A0AAW0BRN9_9AGAR
MKYLLNSLLTAIALATAASAQRTSIGDPSMNTQVIAGTNLDVRIDLQPTTSNVDQVGIAIGLQSCQPEQCFPPDQVLGTLLYKGAYDPQYSSEASSLPPHQNFSVYIPEDFPRGNAILGLVHLGLVGAGYLSVFDTYNITVDVVDNYYY